LRFKAILDGKPGLAMPGNLRVLCLPSAGHTAQRQRADIAAPHFTAVPVLKPSRARHDCSSFVDGLARGISDA
jgi:hypothetical protein